MHELAHCKQMNHSKAFWAVKNEFSSEINVLWEKGYTGDGFWGRGVLLENGAFSHEQLGEGEELPEHSKSYLAFSFRVESLGSISLVDHLDIPCLLYLTQRGTMKCGLAMDHRIYPDHNANVLDSVWRQFCLSRWSEKEDKAEDHV